jgi:hypothetical protein
MAKFKEELPNDLIKVFQELEQDSEKIIGEMTKAGAEKVYKNVLKNVPKSFRASNIMKCLKITKVYKTPSDKGINTKVGFYGYFKNKRGVITPAPLVANIFEHGTSTVKKQTFMRKSFRKAEIESEMKKVQEKYLSKE